MRKINAILTLFLLLNSGALKADIFGTDDRHDVTRFSSQRHLGGAVAVGVLNTLWTDLGDGTSELFADSLADYMCQSERFSRQTSISYACTGFLVAPDLLVTAGHCATNVGEIEHSKDNYCEAYTWLFDYRTSTDIAKVDQRNIYTCKEVIYAIQTEGEATYDFALIRLDRPVQGQKPLKIAGERPKKNDRVTMLGHPMGLPLKYTTNARVLVPQKGRSFLTNLDAFSGNSGSPVLNRRDEVVGVLIAGNPGLSTYEDPKLSCHRYNRCDENGKNCRSLARDNPLEGFPHTYSEVQDISFYLELMRDHL